MKNLSISILISSWLGHIATELCIESILLRTKYSSEYNIIVCDSSPSDSNERKYLRKQRDKGNITLIENDIRLQHGQALWKLLTYCKTDTAILFDSDNEVISQDWIDTFTMPLQDYKKDLCVGFLLKGDNRPNNDFMFAPVLHPSYVVLNMILYRQIMKPDDWMFKKIPMEDFKYKKQLESMSNKVASLWYKNRKLNRARIEYDSGGIFTERMIYENPKDYMIYEMPIEFFSCKVKHYGGMSAYHSRLNTPYMKHKYELLKKRLSFLRDGV